MNGDHAGVLDVLRTRHFQSATEHLGLAVFGIQMRDYGRRLFEATVASNADATFIDRLHATLVWRGR